MRYGIQATPAYELSVELRRTGYGHHLSFVSFLPRVRRPEQQVRFQALLSTPELLALRDAIDDVLSRASHNETAIRDDAPLGAQAARTLRKRSDSSEFDERFPLGGRRAEPRPEN